MDAKEFLTKVRRLAAPQALTIRFNESGMTGLYRLNALLNSSDVMLANEYERAVILAVLMSKDWGGIKNRSYIVHDLQTVGDDMLEAIARDFFIVGDKLLAAYSLYIYCANELS